MNAHYVKEENPACAEECKLYHNKLASKLKKWQETCIFQDLFSENATTWSKVTFEPKLNPMLFPITFSAKVSR